MIGKDEFYKTASPDRYDILKQAAKEILFNSEGILKYIESWIKKNI